MKPLKSPALLAAFSLVLGPITAPAEVPSLLNVQGRVDVAGTNFDGAGEFKFALVNLDGTSTTWSNDETSIAGSEPTDAVTLTVNNGHYSVFLGDKSLPNMAGLDPALFQDDEVALRVWFNDGVNGSQLLTPDQRLVASAYAFNAATVADGAITSSKIASNSITGAKVASNTLTSAHIGPNAIGASELGGNSVGTANVLNGSLLGEDFAAGSISGTALANPLEVGSASTNGTVNVWNASSDVQSVRLSGSNSSIQTYGSDGLIQSRISGTTWGEFQLYDNTPSNNLTANLASHETTIITLPPPSLPVSLPNPGGALSLSNGAERKVYLKGGAGGGYLSLSQEDNDLGIRLDGDTSGGGFASIYQHDAQPGIELDGQGNDITLFQDDDELGVVMSAASSGSISVRDTDGSNSVSLSGSGNSLTLYQDDGGIGVFIDGENSGAGLLNLRNAAGSTRVALDGEGANSGGSLIIDDENGTGTIELLGAQAAGEGGRILLREADGSASVQLRQDTNNEGGGEFLLYDGDGNARIEMEASEAGTDGAQIILRNAAGDTTLTLDAEQGNGGASRVITGTVQITGGSDLSEQFDINQSDDFEALPGMIVSIDPNSPGNLRASTGSYDRTVAGIISGAGGVNPGMLMGQKDSLADGAYPVALTGRVYCYVDHSNGPIEPGDLLTTSDTPGYGMKVTNHEQAQGAIIGKAMTRLEGESGLVLVLVSLQ